MQIETRVTLPSEANIEKKCSSCQKPKSSLKLGRHAINTKARFVSRFIIVCAAIPTTIVITIIIVIVVTTTPTSTREPASASASSRSYIVISTLPIIHEHLVSFGDLLESESSIVPHGLGGLRMLVRVELKGQFLEGRFDFVFGSACFTGLDGKRGVEKSVKCDRNEEDMFSASTSRKKKSGSWRVEGARGNGKSWHSGGRFFGRYGLGLSHMIRATLTSPYPMQSLKENIYVGKMRETCSYRAMKTEPIN
ncbi:Chaperone protein dnaJ 72 [Senna tora]|uniref:Chaperone protein dnaJ 72 n=1 Tax=Senna tora TaxID=362788 RepID=A0A834VY21_9FABA|nr:Chaperone protein dnaJ 72 [Senna tora]